MVKDRLEKIATRRLRAGKMLLAGRDMNEIAAEIGVTRQTVRIWKARLDQAGIGSLRSLHRTGRPTRLNETQRAELRQALLQSPRDHGFGAQLWTIERVGMLVKQLYAVEYGKTQIWNILGELGFCVQKPEQGKIEIDADELRGWTRK